MNKLTAILMIALWLLNHMCGVSAVVCIDAEGQISVEPAMQDRCICQQEDTADTSQYEFNIGSSNCKDIPVALASAVVKLHKRPNLASDVLPTLDEVKTQPLTACRLVEPNFNFLHSYFDPLCSVILNI